MWRKVSPVLYFLGGDFKSYCISQGNVLMKIFLQCSIMCSANHSILGCMYHFNFWKWDKSKGFIWFYGRDVLFSISKINLFIIIIDNSGFIL